PPPSSLAVNRLMPAAEYDLRLHDALPISQHPPGGGQPDRHHGVQAAQQHAAARRLEGTHAWHLMRGTAVCVRGVTISSPAAGPRDRKSTRLNSSHVKISYAVSCLKKTSGV